VIYVGSFSRILFAGARLGYLVAPRDLIRALLAARTYMDGHPTLITQTALAAFFEEGHFSSHLRRMRSLYRGRRDCMLQALAREVPDAPVISAVESGTHLIVAPRWDGPADGADVAMAARLAEAGLTCPALSRYFRDPPGRGGLILGFAGHGEDRIRSGVARLAEIIASPGKVV
jgi:GntR family transcriptional regulator/MocR family aminotransferase